MKKPIALAAIYYQRPHEPSYLPQLERWVNHISKVLGSPYQKSVLIVSDLETPLDGVPMQIGENFLAYLQFPLTDYADVMRHDVWMDRKEAIACAAVKKMGDMGIPMLLVDLDTVFRVNVLRHFDHALHEGRGRYWGMCPDYGRRTVLDSNATRFMEHNAGVMWFGEPEKNAAIVNLYLESFRDLKRLYGDNNILGQKSWSRAHSILKGTLLPKEYNWSHRWVGSEKAYITHYHGPMGKAKMPVNATPT